MEEIGWRDITEMARWWTNQSMAGDKGGSFNIPLYLEYLKCKQSCIDYCTSTNQDLPRAMSSQVRPSAIGNLTNSEEQAPTSMDTL